MATLVLQSAGQALGGLLGPFGALAGRALGAIAGNLLDQQLLGAGASRKVEGPRLDNLKVMSSSEGAAILRVWGRFRVAGELIWATDFEEKSTKRKQGGGKGMGAPSTKVTEYSYYANFAIALCEGPIDRIGRVWADGKEIDISQYIVRLHKGHENQSPDSLIAAFEGVENAPAYRGTAYVVFERLPLESFGNRLPQLSFEVFRAVEDLEQQIKAVNIIPGASEFGYDPQSVKRKAGWGMTLPENTHGNANDSDWTVSMDQLAATCPTLAAGSLVVTWFGNDLRCGSCLIQPGVEHDDKSTRPRQWSVAGLNRDDAYQVSKIDGDPAFGGTPDDEAVLRAIADMKSRGMAVTFYPFLMMDIPANNSLPNPYDPTANQPAYPWRGRITCHPASGMTGSPDQTAAVASQINNFIGTAKPSDFTISNGKVVYSGPNEWSYRRMLLHYAYLCKIAGGVEAFLIGSELRGLTTLRGSSNSFPFVTALASLAGDIATILPNAKISYAADWSEYFGYHPQDGSNDVWFHLDELWANSNIHFIAIDNYMPLADWRDGSDHMDAQNGASSIYDQDYLTGNIAGGEGYDWYYASDNDRQSQTRTSITDGSYNKPWVFRYKDIKNWWSNSHYNRLGGVESVSQTAWQPQSKPVWFTEIGCPAIDKGANQPNVFYDPHSAESAVPRFSSGRRDDYAQRSVLNAISDYWQKPGAHNPISTVYNGPMVNGERMFIWCWDARPFPAFPYLSDVWADADNYHYGHWLNGRLGAVPVEKLVGKIIESYGFDAVIADGLQGVVDGYLLDRVMSAREALEPLAQGFNFDALETGTKIKFVHRDQQAIADYAANELVESGADKPLYQIKRSQESELPSALKLAYVDSEISYRSAAVEARKLAATSQVDSVWKLPMAMAQDVAQARAEVALHDIWAARESAELSLPPSQLRIEPGDVLSFAFADGNRQWRVERINDGLERRLETRICDRSAYQPPPTPRRKSGFQMPQIYGPPRLAVLDVPMVPGAEVPSAPWLATSSSPWPGSIAVMRGSADTGYETDISLPLPAIIGEVLEDFLSGPLYYFDRHNQLVVKLYNGSLSAITEKAVLDGGNAALIGDEQSGFEIIQYADAELIAPDTYRLSVILRGQLGSEPEMQDLLPKGSMFIVMDEALRQLPFTAAMIGVEKTLRAGPGQLDVGHDAFIDHQFTNTGRALRPLSPQHLSVARGNDGLHLNWIRRTRLDGDGWQLADVPLMEETELYRLNILDGAGNIIRTKEVATTSVVYSIAEQITDFETEITTSLHFEVAQISALTGPGAYARANLQVERII